MLGEDGQRRRRRRRKCTAVEEDSAISGDIAVAQKTADAEDDTMTREKISRRECPVPKPGGIVGDILAMRPFGGESRSPKEGGSRPP